MGLHDRVCFSCQGAAGTAAAGAGPPPGLQRLLPAQASRAQAPSGPAGPPGWSVPAPRLPSD